MIGAEAVPAGDSRAVIRSENYTIFTAVTLAYTGYSASFPFIAVYLLQVKSIPISQVGIIYLASGVLGILGQLIGGRLSDILGTKTMTMMGLTVSAVFYFLLSVFVIDNSSVVLFMIAYPVMSLFNNLSQLALSSHVSDRSTSDMASGMSLLYVGLNLGFTIGPVSGGLLIEYYGYSSIFIFGAITTSVSSIAAIILIKSNPKYASRKHDEKNRKGGISRIERGLIPFFALVCISWVVIGYQGIPLSVFESRFLSLSSAEIGLVLTTNGLLITLLQVPISNYIGIERRLRLGPVALGSLLMAAGYVLVGLSRGVIPLEGAITLTTLGEIMIAVPTQVVASMFSRQYNRGKYQGYYFASSRSGLSASSYVGPLIFSLLITRAEVGWYIIAVISMIAGAGYFILSPRLVREHESLIDS